MVPRRASSPAEALIASRFSPHRILANSNRRLTGNPLILFRVPVDLRQGNLSAEQIQLKAHVTGTITRTHANDFASLKTSIRRIIGYFLGGEAVGPRTLLGTFLVRFSVVLVMTATDARKVVPGSLGIPFKGWKSRRDNSL